MEIVCLQRNNTFKFKITLDRHNARLKLIYCLLPGPLVFRYHLPLINNFVQKYVFHFLTAHRTMQSSDQE
jgi:hypothetical protein